VPQLDQRPSAPVTTIVPVAPEQAILSPTAARFHKPVFILFLVLWAANFAILLLRINLSGRGRWIEAAFLVAGVATSLLGLGRRLPLQNVLMAGMIIASVSTAIIAIGVASGVPFGRINYSNRFGEKIFEAVPWAMPMLWVMLVVNGRGVARLVMRPWRKTNFYGFWVIGITCALVVFFDMIFEPFGIYVKDWWIWQTRGSSLAWYRAPWVNFMGWFMTALAVLIFSIPWLINKRPVKQPTDYHPLAVWLLLNLGLAAVNAAHGLWMAAVTSAVLNFVATFYAMRGARW